MKRKVVVLGAGLSGLSVAWKLSESNFHVLVLEKNSYVGGASSSVISNGYTFDFGPHGFHSDNDDLIEIFKDIVENQYIKKDKKSKILFKGKYYNYPLKIKDVLFNMSPALIVQASFSYFWTYFKRKLYLTKDDSAESWIINRYGRVLYEDFFGPYTRKVWGVEPSELDSDFAQDRIPDYSLMDIIKKMLFKIDQKRKTPSDRVATHDVEVFYYPHNGIHVLPENLAKRVTRAKGDIFLESRINNIEISPEKMITFERNNAEEKVEFDYLVSTIPISDFSALLSPTVDTSIQKAIESLKSRALIFVFLMVDKKEEIFESQWIYFYDKAFTRMSETKKFSKDVVPEGKTGICIEISCDVGDDIYKADNEFIYKFIMEELVSTEFVTEDDIEGYLIAREPNAYVVYLKDYKENMKKILTYMNGLGNIFFCGRQGLFKYINMDQAIASGLKIADEIINLDIKNKVAAK